MARRRRHKRSLKGFGNIISVRKGMNGLTDTNSMLGAGVAVAGGAAAVLGSTMLIRKFAAPAVASAAASTGASGLGSISSMLSDYAPLVGTGLGIGAAYALGRGGYRGTATVMAASAVIFGLTSQFRSQLGLGAIVPEYGMGYVMPQVSGLGATVLEEWPSGQRPDSIGSLGDAYGTSVNLSGLGAVNTGAFGTPGFHV